MALHEALRNNVFQNADDLERLDDSGAGDPLSLLLADEYELHESLGTLDAYIEMGSRKRVHLKCDTSKLSVETAACHTVSTLTCGKQHHPTITKGLK